MAKLTYSFLLLRSICVTMIPLVAVAQECSDAATTCLDCLTQDGCDAWSIGECFPSCSSAPQDMSCYSSEYFVNQTSEDICAAFDMDTANADLCSGKSDCGSCIDTALLDSSGFCQWFEEGEYCQSGCGLNGCGVSECSDVILDCNNGATTCLDCLTQDGCDAWSEGECFPSCSSAPLDVSCYSSEYRPDETSEEICAHADMNTANADLCSGKSDCGSCVGTALLDSSGFCKWIEEGEYCDFECGYVNECGSTTCRSNGSIMTVSSVLSAATGVFVPFFLIAMM